MSLSFFLFLPMPLKIAAVILGGFFWFGVNNVHVEEIQVERVEGEIMPAPAQIPAAPVKPAAVKPAEAVVIIVNSDGSFTMAGEKLTGVQLQKKLKTIVVAQPNRAVVLKADALTPHQMVVSGVDLCKKAGAKNVSFATRPAAP